MRLLVDEHGMEWDPAWRVTVNALSYANHTLQPETLEQWPRSLFTALLLRHMETVDEINRRHIDDVRRRFPGDEARVARISFINENGAEGENTPSSIVRIGGQRRLSGSGTLDTPVHSERRAHRQVLLRSRHSRLLLGNMENLARQRPGLIPGAARSASSPWLSERRSGRAVTAAGW